MCRPRAHRSQGTTLGVVLTFHLVSGQSLFVTGRWDVEAGLASLQAPGNSPVCCPSHHRDTEVTDVHRGPAVHGLREFELRPLCLQRQVLDVP